MLKVLERSHDDVIAFEADGVVTREEIEEMNRLMDEAIVKHGKISWLCVWKAARFDNLGTFYKDMTWMLKHVCDFDRMAFVGDSWWKKFLVEADGLVFGEKYFDTSRFEEAWDYVDGR